MTGIALRPASSGDFEFLFGLHRDALGAYVDAIWGWDDDFQRSMFTERFDPSANEIVEVDGEAIGCLRVTETRDSMTLEYVALLPGWQRRGIGSELVRRVQKRGADLGLPVRLSVLRPNPARRLYERLGFRVVEEDDTRVRMVWGEDDGDGTRRISS